MIILMIYPETEKPSLWSEICGPKVFRAETGELLKNGLSHILLKIPLINLPVKLAAIPDIHHATYADDITIWIHKGSETNMHDRLQQAAKAVQAYANGCGLTCDPPKS